MLSHKNYKRSFLWIDYKKEHPNGYQLAQFYKLYRDFMVDTYGTSKTSMPVERIPGEKMFIDWVGDQPELLLDTTTGELQKVHIFTTTLGFSSLVYAEIFPDEKRIKNHYMKYLGIDALIIGAIASIVLGICFYFTRWIGCISVGIECEPIRVDDYTGKKMTFFHDPDGLPLELHE